jgi:hypothetical protein
MMEAPPVVAAVPVERPAIVESVPQNVIVSNSPPPPAPALLTNDVVKMEPIYSRGEMKPGIFEPSVSPNVPDKNVQASPEVRSDVKAGTPVASVPSFVEQQAQVEAPTSPEAPQVPVVAAAASPDVTASAASTDISAPMAAAEISTKSEAAMSPVSTARSIEGELSGISSVMSMPTAAALMGDKSAATTRAAVARAQQVSSDDTKLAEDKKLVGFGKKVPLAIALRQIIPQEYEFTHGEGVNLNKSVNWSGGRVWSEVLSDAIKPLGLKATLAGDTVMIEKEGKASPTANIVVSAPAVAEVAPPLTPVVVAVAPPVAPSVAEVASPIVPDASTVIAVPVSESEVSNSMVRPAAFNSGPAILTNATVMQNPPTNN